jgi:hypothetical protein
MSQHRRIVVMTEDLPGGKQQEFVDWLSSQGAGWARWFSGGWLVATGKSTPKPSVADIVTQLQKLQPGHPCLVFEITGGMVWQGFLPVATVDAAKRWFREQWGEIVP